MRTGADYREALRDGRKVWVLGEGKVEDVTTHPATSAMVEEYVAWYDRHLDRAWQDVLFASATPERQSTSVPNTSKTSARTATGEPAAFTRACLPDPARNPRQGSG